MEEGGFQEKYSVDPEKPGDLRWKLKLKLGKINWLVNKRAGRLVNARLITREETRRKSTTTTSGTRILLREKRCAAGFCRLVKLMIPVAKVRAM